MTVAHGSQAPAADVIADVRHADTLLSTVAWQRAMFHCVHVWSIVTDATGVIRIFSVGAERMLGYAAADVLNRITPADMADPQELGARARALGVELGTTIAPGFEALVFKAARGLEDSYDLTCIRKDGSRFPALVSVTALRDAQGTVIGYLLIGTDNPARPLPGTIRDPLEEQSQQAQKMEAIGRLAGGVAHDFNNLLTVILGYCEMLLADRDRDDPRQSDIAEIQKAATRAAGLTGQLLAFSRKQIIEPALLDLNGVVGDLQAMLGRLVGGDVKVVLELRPELALVNADRGQVEQIVLNLAVNARDAMPRGGTLTIGTANVDLDEHYAKTHLAVKPGPYIGLTVTDTGTGMTSQVQARLFEPFFTTKEPGKGTGLGMATVYGIVKRSGGSIGVQSEVGRGTSFKVYFPRADAPGLAGPLAPAVARPRAGTQTVLVVEDEEGLRALAKRLLERQGYTVLAAADADEALQLFERNPSIDVLLTDVVMPGASGPELTRQLVERRPTLKVIYMSGYTEDAVIHRGVLNSGIAFLHKPFTGDALALKIREVLDR